MIKAIMAVDEAWGIGKKGTLPWPANKEDLKQFKDKTTGHIVVMGSKTWKDPCFPAPLKNRENMVVTNDPWRYPGADFYLHMNIADQIKEIDARDDRDVWIIGGAKVIEQCWDIIEEFHLTIIKGNYDCDTKLNVNINEFTIIDSTITNENIYYTYRRER